MDGYVALLNPFTYYLKCSVMKKLLSGIIAIAICLNSCEKDNTEFTNLEGNWVIKKAYADPGDGSGRYRNVPDKNYIEFFKDGSARSNYAVFGLHMLRSFSVTDSVRVILTFKDISSQPATTYRYKFSGDTLILNPPCIEVCGLKLVRSK